MCAGGVSSRPRTADLFVTDCAFMYCNCNLLYACYGFEALKPVTGEVISYILDVIYFVRRHLHLFDPSCDKGVFSFIILSQLQRPIELKFSQVC